MSTVTHYEEMPGGVVIWVSDIGSGVVMPDTPEWDEYEAWLAAGNEPSLTMPPPVVTQAMAMAQVDKAFTAAVEPLIGAYPQAEIDSWPMQTAEARAYMADPAAQTPLIDGILLPGEDKSEFCATLLAKSATYATEMGQILMWHRIAVAAVEASFANGPRQSFSVIYPEVPSAS